MNTDFSYTFSAGYAKKYGVNEAIMLGCFIFWIAKNEANGKHFHDGRTWTYNSVAAFERLFPFWTKKQIRTVLDSLEKQGVIMKGNYNEQKYDRTSWYAFTDEFAKTLCPEGQMHVSQTGKSICLKGQMEMTKRANRNDQKGKPIPVTIPVNIPDNSSTDVLLHSVVGENSGAPENDPAVEPARMQSALPLFDEGRATAGDPELVEQPSAKNLQPAAGAKEKSCAKKEKPAARQLALVPFLVELGVSEETARSWDIVRKATKAVNSPRAFDGIRAELLSLQERGVDPEYAVGICCEKSWRGIKADWIVKEIEQQLSADDNRFQQQKAAPARPSKYDQNAQAMADAIDFLNQRV